MNRIETFEQFLNSSSSQFSLVNFPINLILTALLAFLLGLLYNRYGNSLSNRKAFSKNFVLLAVAIMIVITIVKSSLALSLGLVGALSIVRFRAAIKEPEELSFLFLNIAIGLGFGADQKLATITGFIFISLYLMGKNILYKKTDQENQNLIITVKAEQPVKDQLNGILEILTKNSEKLNLKRFNENNEILEISFLIETGNFNNINKAKEELQERYKNLTISFIDNNIMI